MPVLRTSPSVVVGIDGSQSATAAALWAIDEAVARDLPLRLVFALWPRQDPSSASHDLVDEAVGAAIAAVEASGKPVKLEAEIVHGRPALVLRAQSHGAAMMCLGSSGPALGGVGCSGSTVSAVASFRCPVAIIHSDSPSSTDPGWVVAEVSDTPAGELALRRGVDEALLRHAALRIVATWQTRYTDIHDAHAIADGNRSVKAHWERRLGPWRARHPELDAHAVATPGSVFNYLARQRRKIRLVVLPHERATEVAELLDPQGSPAARDICFDVLICESTVSQDAERIADDTEPFIW
jgi:nucleotide-binding universal stress UspA family protein